MSWRPGREIASQKGARLDAEVKKLTFPIPDWKERKGISASVRIWSARAHLEGKEVLGKTTGGNLVAEELNQVLCDQHAVRSLGGVPSSVVGASRFDDGHHALGVDVDEGLADTGARVGDEVGLAIGRKEALVDIVEALEGRNVGVDPATMESALRLVGTDRTHSMMIFSAVCRISGVAPTDAPGTIAPSSVDRKSVV